MLLARLRISFARWFRLGPGLFAGLTVPLGDAAPWHHLQFSDIPQNQVSFASEGLTLDVNGSSSPLFYPFPKPVRVARMQAQGNLGGLPRLPSSHKEGTSKADDFALRIGLVLAGEKRLSWLERLFAPRWIKRLEDLVPDQAFYKVWFLSVSQQLPKGFKRTHPQSEVLLEEVGLKVDGPGPFALEHGFDPPPLALGMWIHADGDDTKSQFQTQIHQLQVEIAPALELSNQTTSPD